MRERLNAIKALRLAHQPPLRQADLARRLGVDRGVISLYENGQREPSIRKAVQLARVFRVSVEEVFYGMFEAVDTEQAEHEVSGERAPRLVPHAYRAGDNTPPASRIDAEKPHARW